MFNSKRIDRLEDAVFTRRFGPDCFIWPETHWGNRIEKLEGQIAMLHELIENLGYEMEYSVSPSSLTPVRWVKVRK